MPDADRLQWAKSLTLFDKRIIELEKEYAHNLLTHVNPYTKTEYRNEPAIAIVEILNENGIGQGYNPPVEVLRRRTRRSLQHLAEDQPLRPNSSRSFVSRPACRAMRSSRASRGNERATAPKDRYETEVRFFMDLENGFYQDMKTYLRELGVKQPLIGTADHGHSGPPWAMLTSLSKLDVLDGHIYWNQYVGVGDVPMVNDPLHSTVVQLVAHRVRRQAVHGQRDQPSVSQRICRRGHSDPRRLRRLSGLGHDHPVHLRAQERPGLEALRRRSVRHLARPRPHDRNGRGRADVPARRRASRRARPSSAPIPKSRCSTPDCCPADCAPAATSLTSHRAFR